MYEAFEPIIKKGKAVVQASPSLLKTFESLYTSHVGIGVCPTCPGGFDTAWDLFVNLYNNHSKKSKMKTVLKEFEFKDGAIPWSTVSCKHYGPANATDADCIALLAEAEGNLVHFKKFPADWKERVKNLEKKAAKPAAATGKKVTAPATPAAPATSTAPAADGAEGTAAPAKTDDNAGALAADVKTDAPKKAAKPAAAKKSPAKAK